MNGLRRFSQNGNGRAPDNDTSAKLVWSLQKMEATHRGWEIAENMVEKTIGRPICMEKCGKCCEVTSVQGWEIEAYYLAGWLLGQDTSDRIISDCEGWLTEKDSRFPTMGPIGGGLVPLSPEQLQTLLPELTALKDETPCPFLSELKGCLIHEARPLVCRAYGVTRMPGILCPRPLGEIETLNMKAHISHTHEVGIQLKTMVTESIKASESMQWNKISFLATAVMRLMRPDKFKELVYDGKVATARLMQFYCTSENHPVILFQDQLDKEWERVYSTQGGEA